MFLSIFEPVKNILKPLGTNLLPSDILWKENWALNFVLVALGLGWVWWLDAMYSWNRLLWNQEEDENSEKPKEDENSEKPKEDENQINVLDVNMKMSDMNREQSKLFAQRVFGKWPGTDLLIKLSNQKPDMIKRVVALAKHEWWLNFGRKNIDPNTASQQINIWTFQLSAKSNEIVDKYNKSLNFGKKLLDKYDIKYSSNDLKNITTYVQDIAKDTKSKAQCDLVSWLGYIDWYRNTGSVNVLEKLADPNLKDDEVKTLISKNIQWWIPEIWKSVVKQLANNSVKDYKNIA